MSRVAKKPVELAKGVSAEVQGQTVTVKGAKGSLAMHVNRGQLSSRCGQIQILTV